MSEFTDDELAGLSEEERKAIEEENVPGDEPAGDEPADEEPGEETPAGEEMSADGDAPAGEETGSVEGPEGEPDRPAASTTQPPLPFVQFLDVKADADLQAKLEELNKQLEEGDIDLVEYTRLRDPIILQQVEARLAEKFNQQSAEQLWKYEQRIFFGQNRQYREDPAMNGALQAVFKSLDTQENAHKTGLELLNEAKDLVEASLAKRYGAVGKQESNPAPEKSEAQPPKDKKPAIEKAELPRTLANVPPADTNDTGRNEFSHLDKLTGVEYEKAVARLTPDQQARDLAMEG